MPGPAACAGPARPGSWSTCCWQGACSPSWDTRRSGTAGRGTGRAARGGPDRVRDDPGAAEARPGSAARAVLPAARPGPGRGAVAGTAGGRDRRHDHDRCRQRGEPGRLLQAARRQERRLRLPDAAAAGPGQLRNPHRHRRRVQPRLQRRDHLRPGTARQPARGHDPARRPELRRRVPGRADRGNQGRLPDPGPLRERRPEAPGPEPPAATGPGCRASAASPSGSSTPQVTVTTSTGHATSGCRLVTTLLDPARYPAREVAVLYRERWEVESAYFELKSTILGGRVLRARTPGGIDQEVYALLITYQVLRTAIADAAGTVPGTDPDRASFTVALNAARDQVILAAGVLAGPATDLAGTIGRLVLASLMPSRRLRTSPRVVKRAMSRYNARGKVDRATRKATIAIAILGVSLTPDEEP